MFSILISNITNLNQINQLKYYQKLESFCEKKLPKNNKMLVTSPDFECLLAERVESRAGGMIMMPTTKLVVAVTESLGLSNLTLPGEFPHV